MQRSLHVLTLHTCAKQHDLPFCSLVWQRLPSFIGIKHLLLFASASAFHFSCGADGFCGSFPRRQERSAIHVVHVSSSHTATATTTSVLLPLFSVSLFFVHHTAGCPSAHSTCAHRHRLRTQTAELIAQRRSRLTRGSTGAGSFSTASTPNFVYK